MRNPWAKFYFQDWRGDPRLRICTLAARGLWIEILAIADQADPRGHLLIEGRAPTDTQLAMLAGAPPDQIPSLLDELDAAGVFSKTRKGVIYSRRMVNDEKKNRLARHFGEKGGNPKLKGGYNKPGYVYLIGVRSDGAHKIGISVNPQNRLTKIRAQYPVDDLAVLDAWHVIDMGAKEAELHQQFAQKKSGEWFFLTALELCKLRENMRTLKGVEKRPLNAQKPEARVQKEVFSAKAFTEFWEAFSDKRGKEPALRSWKAIRGYDADLHREIIAGARRYAAARPGLLANGGTPKMAQGWLTDRRWEDAEAPTKTVSELPEFIPRKQA